MAPYTLRIPPIVGAEAGLCYYCRAPRPPRLGKSSTLDIGSELLPANAQPSSGPSRSVPAKASSRSMFERATRGRERRGSSARPSTTCSSTPTRATPSALSARTELDLESTLRSIWTGKDIGDTNATEERRRHRPGPHLHLRRSSSPCQAPAAGALLANVATGLPQRFGWAVATHPDIPPPAGDPTTTRPARVAARRNGYGSTSPPKSPPRFAPPTTPAPAAPPPLNPSTPTKTSPLQGRRLLAMLDRPVALDSNACQVTIDIGSSPAMVKRASDAARAHAIDESAEHTPRRRRTARRLGHRQATAADVVEAHRLTKAVDVARCPRREGVGQPTGGRGAALRRRSPAGTAPTTTAALAHAEAEEWVDVREEPGQPATRNRSSAPGRGGRA